MFVRLMGWVWASALEEATMHDARHKIVDGVFKVSDVENIRYYLSS